MIIAMVKVMSLLSDHRYHY